MKRRVILAVIKFGRVSVSTICLSMYITTRISNMPNEFKEIYIAAFWLKCTKYPQFLNAAIFGNYVGLWSSYLLSVVISKLSDALNYSSGETLWMLYLVSLFYIGILLSFKSYDHLIAYYFIQCIWRQREDLATAVIVNNLTGKISNKVSCLLLTDYLHS